MNGNKVSLERFANFHDEVKGVEIRSHLNLPEYVPASEAEVNIGRIATICRVGRLESVNFKLTDGESGGVSAMVGGINPDGSATAIGGKSKSVARAVSEHVENDTESTRIPRGVARIRINTNHPDMDDKSLRDVNTWTEMIDKAMRQGLSESAHKQLIKSHMSDRIVQLIILGAVCPPTAVFLGAPIPSAVLGSVFAAARAYELKGDPERKLLPGFAYDRYAVARSILATRKIVKPS